MSLPSERFSLETKRSSLSASLAPWDTGIFGFPVAQIERFAILEPESFEFDYECLETWVNSRNCGMVSCRLGHDRLVESMFLEAKGFRFVEMVLHPEFPDLHRLQIPDQGLEIAAADESDLTEIRRIAETAFKDGRFHLDPRIDSRLADSRYGRWVESSLRHPTQQLLKIRDGQTIVGFFIVEIIDDCRAYWHLTAVSPDHQGKGYGRRTWLAVLQHHVEQGVAAVSTTISARNIAVLNLYSSLNFRFRHPEMTFHWLRERN